jgi:hypothetical protein
MQTYINDYSHLNKCLPYNDRNAFCVCLFHVLQGLPGCLPWGVMQTDVNDYLHVLNCTVCCMYCALHCRACLGACPGA